MYQPAPRSGFLSCIETVGKRFLLLSPRGKAHHTIRVFGVRRTSRIFSLVRSLHDPAMSGDMVPLMTFLAEQPNRSVAYISSAYTPHIRIVRSDESGFGTALDPSSSLPPNRKPQSLSKPLRIDRERASSSLGIAHRRCDLSSQRPLINKQVVTRRRFDWKLGLINKLFYTNRFVPSRSRQYQGSTIKLNLSDLSSGHPMVPYTCRTRRDHRVHLGWSAYE